jgi:hypothetical protein
MSNASRAILVVPLCMLLWAPGLGCSKDSPKDAGFADGTPGDGVGSPEKEPECRRPPLNFCEPPGRRATCPNHWYCPGCNCSGTFKVAACSALTQDCRWFCTGCYPQEYVACDPSAGATPEILGRCGYCFMTDAGIEMREDCDRLNAILDAQPAVPKDAGGPVDATPPLDAAPAQ